MLKNLKLRKTIAGMLSATLLGSVASISGNACKDDEIPASSAVNPTSSSTATTVHFRHRSRGAEVIAVNISLDNKTLGDVVEEVCKLSELPYDESEDEVYHHGVLIPRAVPARDYFLDNFNRGCESWQVMYVRTKFDTLRKNTQSGVSKHNLANGSLFGLLNCVGSAIAPYNCPLCDEGFWSAENLTKHLFCGCYETGCGYSRDTDSVRCDHCQKGWCSTSGGLRAFARHVTQHHQRH